MVDASSMKRLVDNNIRLQQLSISLIESNKELIRRLDNLVNLFEDAARSMPSTNNEELFKLNSKINSLIQENKQLARGLVLMENKMKMGPRPGMSPRPIPRL